MHPRFLRFLSFYDKHEWVTAFALFISYLAVSYASSSFLPLNSHIRPEYGIAIGALFLGGLRLWPVVAAVSSLSVIIGGVPEPYGFALPIGATLQAILGAALLRRVGIDPIFRRTRDMGYVVAITLVISLIYPTLVGLVSILGGISYSFSMWGYTYVATLFSILTVTPLILRWFSKRHFIRHPAEIIEILAVFAILISINLVYFLDDTEEVFGISLLYFLLVPLFWIALRLRPRFVTLAIVITSICAIMGTILTTAPIDVTPHLLYEVELLLIALAVIFYIIVSLQEDRRVNSNLIQSQLFTLKNALARVSSESRAKNDFIAILAHELRNPLAPVLSGIEFLKLKGGRDTSEIETLTTMSERMDIVRRHLDDLLDVSRISESKVRLARENIDLIAAIKNAVVSTEHHRHELHQRLIFKGADTSARIIGDAVRIEQVFSNLLTNASKYSNAGDTIRVTVRKVDDKAEVEISDEGIGLEQKMLESIFMPFQQVEQGERTKQGLGIGLALVKNFVEGHGGSVTAESKGKDKGSRFIVRLPLASPSEKITKDGVGAPELLENSPASRALRILVADDNDAAAGGIGRLLELQGCIISYAYNGRQTIQRALRDSPDVILLDIGLPDITGYEVSRTLRDQGFIGRVIALTGYSADKNSPASTAAGFDDYIVKPAGLSDLRRAIPEL